MISLRRFAPVSLLAAALLALPQAAAAHDELVSTDPADGATVQEAPDELTLTFSGQIAEVGAAVAVTDASGASVVDGEPEVEGVTVVQELVDDLAAGDYEVVWRVTSQDGHPISGTFGFVVAEGAADDGSDDDATDAATDDASDDDSDAAATDEGTTEDASVGTDDEVSDDATADDADEAPATDTQDDATATRAATGMPVWAWVVVGLGVAGLVALLARTWSRNRP